MKNHIIANGLSSEAYKTLENAGFNVIKTEKNPAVAEPVSFHADISFFFDGEDTLFIAPQMSAYKTMFEKIVDNVIIVCDKFGKKYPQDVLLNCVTLGRKLICNVDTVSPTVLEYLKKKGFSVINVKQGYTKCSVVPVSDNALITDDPSISESCLAEGADVLYVSKGNIKLDGYDYGFIGGASGKISSDTVAFCGNIFSHPDSSEIIRFLQKYGMNPLSLDNNQLYDVGSIIPLYGG